MPYGLEAKQLSQMVHFTPAAGASNAKDPRAGQVRLVTQWLPAQGAELAVVSVDPRTGAQVATPLLGTALMVPDLSAHDATSEALDVVAPAAARDASTAWADVAWAPCSGAARDGRDPGPWLLAPERATTAGTAVAVPAEAEAGADEELKKHKGPRPLPSGYLARVMVSQDASFRDEEAQRVAAAEGTSLRGIVLRADTPLAAKVALLLRTVVLVSMRDLRRLFDVHYGSANAVAPDNAALLEALRTSALLVQGVWVCRDYPGRVAEGSRARAQLHWQYLLWVLARQGWVRRRALREATGMTPAQAHDMLQRVAVLDAAAPVEERRWYLKVPPCTLLASDYPELQHEYLAGALGPTEGPRLLEAAAEMGSQGQGGRRVKRALAAAPTADAVVKEELDAEQVAERVRALFAMYGVVCRKDLELWARSFPEAHVHAAVETLLNEVREGVYVLRADQLPEAVRGADRNYGAYRDALLALLARPDGSTPVVKKSQVMEEVKRRGLPTMPSAVYKDLVWTYARNSGTNWTLKTGRFKQDPKSSTKIA